MPTYSETLDFLFSRLPMFTQVGASAYKKDLSNTIALCKILDNPERKFKSIHIAGTNGKGSSSHMLAAILQAQGYKTGLYTSPHLRDFRERIRINGEMISEEAVIAFTETMKTAMTDLVPSFFEMTVAMAFDYFVKNEVDIAVIETGMGGRLDSTNVIEPELSLITNIGLDHMEFLGNDLASIAGEKAGIIKSKIPAVIGKTQPETVSIFTKKANQLEAPIAFADQLWKIDFKARDESFQYFEAQRLEEKSFALKLDLLGSYQAANLPGVLEAIRQLNEAGRAISDQSILNGLESVKSSTGLMGRWQILSTHPRIICDTGHNEDGIKEVIGMLANERYEHLHVVIGMVGDKEVDKVLQLFPTDATYYFTQAAIPRAMPVDTLYEKAQVYRLHGNTYYQVSKALEAAKNAVGKNDLIFVGGSTFVVAEVV